MNRNWKPSKSEILSKHVGTFLEIYGGDFPWGAATHKFTKPFKHVFMRDIVAS